MNGVNLFDLMYKDPKRYGFIFQSYVQLTMLEMHDEIRQLQNEQTRKFNKQLLEQQDAESERTNKIKILKDLTNKDQKIEINEKKRKASQMTSNECTNLSSKLMKTNHQEQTKLDQQTNCRFEVLQSDFTDEQQTVDYSINMMERSIFSARYIFVENLHQK